MARSNYADRPNNNENQGALPEHRDRLSCNPRAYTPSEGEHEEGGYSTLMADAGGDWSWRPARYYPKDPGDSTRAQLEAQMPTYRPARHSRACTGCGLTSCLSLITRAPTLCA